jgi:hypothetical protein
MGGFYESLEPPSPGPGHLDRQLASAVRSRGVITLPSTPAEPLDLQHLADEISDR